MTVRHFTRCLILLVLVVHTRQALSEPAADVVNELQQGIVSILQSSDNVSFSWRYESFRKLVDRTHDMAFISRLTVHRAWPSLTETQQSELIERLARLSAATYASRFRSYSKQQFQILGEHEQARGNKLVKAQLVTLDGKQVSFEYLLHKVNDDWLIVNIIVDGVSDLALKRAEYSGYVRSGGYDELIQSLDRQIEQAQQ